MKANFGDLQALRTKINGYDDDLDILDRNYHSFLTVTKTVMEQQ